jgi:hypothetical protein
MPGGLAILQPNVKNFGALACGQNVCAIIAFLKHGLLYQNLWDPFYSMEAKKKKR